MRKFLVALFALFFLVGGSASVAMAAQSSGTPAAAEEDAAPKNAGEPTAFGIGLDAPATYFSKNGREIGTLSVVEVERDWQDYGEYSEPDAGVEYVAVTFQVESVSKSKVPVKAYDFSLLDALGFNNSRSYTRVADDAETVLFEDDTVVASGESGEFTLVFELFEDTELGYFMWQPESGVILMVDLAGE